MISFFNIIITILFVISILPYGTPYASYMTTSSYCSLSLSVGSNIMSSSASYSSQYELTVKRGSTQMLSSLSSHYYPGESLTVSFPASGSMQFVIQASGGATFSGSSGIGCSGTRSSGAKSVQLIMPPIASGNITVWAGWSSSYGHVSISPAVILLPSKQTLAPISRAPTVKPTIKSQVTSSSSSSSSSSLSPTSINLLIGVLVGIGGFITISMLGYFYIRRNGGKFPSLSLTTSNTSNNSTHTIFNHHLSNSNLLTTVPSALSVGSGILCLILVCLWATNGNNGTTQNGYLGVPEWKTNPLAYHATFLVGGFFLSQLIAILVWTNFPAGGKVPKPLHAIIHTLGMVSLIIGLVEIVKYVNSQSSPALTTMHSWTGVMAVAVYGAAYLLGALHAILKYLKPSHPLLSIIDWIAVHRTLGVTGVALTAAAILTGVMDYLPQGACSYNNMDSPFVDYNPAKNYYALPTACKLANGLGVATVVAVMFLGVALMNRHTYKRDKIEPSVNDALPTKNAATSADPTLEDVYSGSKAPTAP